MKLKTTHLAAFAAITLAGSASAATIAGGNGSFETVTLGTPLATDLWYLTDVTISGWTLEVRTPSVNGAVWFMGGNDYGPASEGYYKVNVLSGGTSYFLSTTIAGLTVGNSYTVNFDARQRDGSAYGNFDVVVDTTVPSGGFDITPTSTAWAQQSFTFTATASSHTLKIANYDYTTQGFTAGGNGFMVDNFSVVPEPGAALLGSLGMLALLRRRRA